MTRRAANRIPHSGLFRTRRAAVLLFALLLSAALLLTACSVLDPKPDNMPYEPPTPAPAAHDGSFVSEHGSMRFHGDGESVVIDFDEELAELTGLPAGEHDASYVFLSGVLPPHGSMPVRYDVAHELRLTVGETSVVIDMGLVSEDGRTASVGVDVVTPERIPMLFRGDSYTNIIFYKEK